jgi:membrane protein YdbS with pleckstrin-like domain
MANDEPVRAASLSEQISTSDPAVVEAPPIDELIPPAPVAPPTQVAAPATAPAPDSAPIPAQPESTQAAAEEAATPNKGFGMEGEFNVWEGRYSFKNFFGRIAFRVLLTIAWIALAVYVWGTGSTRDRMIHFVTIVTGVALLVFWLYLLWQVLMARLGHYYRLTNRRLFVSTGIFNRRRDQVELLSVKDVYTRQPSLFHRWWSVGTVVVESSEEKYPITYLTGVDDPKAVMDLVWHCARAEREGKAVQIDHV